MNAQAKGILQLVLVGAFLATAVLVSLALANLRTRPQPSARTGARVLRVETVLIRPQSAAITFTSTGSVQVRASVDVVPQVTGRVIKISDTFYPGGEFAANAELFQIEPIDYQLEIDRLAAEVARAQTQSELVQAEADAALAEWRSLHAETEPPPLVAKRPQLAEAEAALAAARAQLAIARLNLQRTSYALPFQGRVLQTALGLGLYVRAGQSYGKTYSHAAIEVDLPLQDQQLAWLLAAEQPQITVRANLLAKPIQLKGYVKRLGAEVDPTTRFARVVLGLHTLPAHLVPGVFVEVTVVGAQHDNVWKLPLAVLQQDETIWTVDAQNRLRQLAPAIIQISHAYALAESNGESIRVVVGTVSGATPGTKVQTQAANAQ